MILVDANILMYSAGTEHPNKAPSIRFLERVVRGEIDAALDAEVLQEILHRYRALNRWSLGRRVYDHARQIFSVVLPVTAETLDIARMLLDSNERISARDALHAAVVEANRLEAICTFDRGFDLVHAIHRVEPDKL